MHASGAHRRAEIEVLYKITFPDIFKNHTKRVTQDPSRWVNAACPGGSVSAPGVQPGFLLAQRGRCHQYRAVTTALSSTQTGAWHIVGARKHPLMNAGGFLCDSHNHCCHLGIQSKPGMESTQPSTPHRGPSTSRVISTDSVAATTTSTSQTRRLGHAGAK